MSEKPEPGSPRPRPQQHRPNDKTWVPSICFRSPPRGALHRALRDHHEHTSRSRSSMKTHVQALVIGGGVVGCSVLFHLTRLGWTDVALCEREELTAGSSWHAAGGFHALNSDPNVAKLQAYTVRLYKEIQQISGQDV